MKESLRLIQDIMYDLHEVSDKETILQLADELEKVAQQIREGVPR